MSNFLSTWYLAHGNVISAPIGIQPRGVFDALGQRVAHVEISSALRHTQYVIHEVYPGGPVPAGTIHLGALVESFGGVIVHFYAEVRDAN